ncbi:sarcosine oxidase subunit gamma [Nitratireductor sp. GCM10026969]|uniref:sarcosine oxidase subunit gamma n=1 Tax=Nitratireductor sp. GCM10026969 TaxID=3252645 RepID=UPI00361873B9
MVERESSLGPALRPGLHGRSNGGSGVTLSEVTPTFMAEATAWPGGREILAAAIGDVTGLTLSASPNAGALGAGAAAFSIGPERFLVTGSEGLAARLAAAVPLETGTVTDLSHGRTVIRIAGPRAEWVLSKLFAIDFSAEAFAVAEGRATMHHDTTAQIQRTGATQFDIFVSRSLARSFWRILGEASAEVGYEVLSGEE